MYIGINNRINIYIYKEIYSALFISHTATDIIMTIVIVYTWKIVCDIQYRKRFQEDNFSNVSHNLYRIETKFIYVVELRVEGYWKGNPATYCLL